jgi:hypothetical protein
MGEATKILIAAAHRWLDLKPQQKPQVRTITDGVQMLAIEHKPGKTGKKGKKGQQAAAPTVQTVALPSPKTNNNNNNKKDGQNTQQNQNQGKKDGKGATQQVNKTGQPGNQSANSFQKKKKFKKPYFIAPWPVGKEYLSKNGNNLRKEFEDYFWDVCHRCGHSSHTADRCKTYPDKSTVLTLCEICRQGLHDCCKSRRPDLVQKDILNQVKKMYNKMCTSQPPIPPGYWQYSVPPPPVPPPQHFQPSGPHGPC